MMTLFQSFKVHFAFCWHYNNLLTSAFRVNIGFRIGFLDFSTILFKAFSAEREHCMALFEIFQSQCVIFLLVEAFQMYTNALTPFCRSWVLVYWNLLKILLKVLRLIPNKQDISFSTLIMFQQRIIVAFFVER